MFAFSPADPEPRDVYSANRKFVLALDPDLDLQPVYAVEDREEPIWELNWQLWQEDFYIADDGKVVAVVSWMFVTEESYGLQAVGFYDSFGVVKSYSYSELCPDPYTTNEVVGPVGDFWRRWLWSATESEGRLSVHAVDGSLHSFELQSGKLVSSRSADAMPRSSDWIRGWYWLLLVLTATALFGVGFLTRRRIARRSHAIFPT